LEAYKVFFENDNAYWKILPNIGLQNINSSLNIRIFRIGVIKNKVFYNYKLLNSIILLY